MKTRQIPVAGGRRVRVEGKVGTVFEQAHREATEPATDDAQLVERLGVPVVLIPDLSTNLKITTPEDLEIEDPQ